MTINTYFDMRLMCLSTTKWNNHRLILFDNSQIHYLNPGVLNCRYEYMLNTVTAKCLSQLTVTVLCMQLEYGDVLTFGMLYI